MIFLIRHGNGTHNQTKDYDNPEHIDAPLTEKGRKEAMILKIHPELQNPDIIISSPLSRALETANLAFPDSIITIDPLCREIKAHVCDLLKHEIVLNLPKESNEEMISRAKLFFRKIKND
jgi:broad specificity phosphatase PhoE